MEHPLAATGVRSFGSAALGGLGGGADVEPEQQKTTLPRVGEYNETKPQNVEYPTVPIISMSRERYADSNGKMPDAGNALRTDAIRPDDAGGWLKDIAGSAGESLYKEAVGTSEEVSDWFSTLLEIAYEMYDERRLEENANEDSWVIELLRYLLT